MVGYFECDELLNQICDKERLPEALLDWRMITSTQCRHLNRKSQFLIFIKCKTQLREVCFTCIRDIGSIYVRAPAFYCLYCFCCFNFFTGLVMEEYL